MSDHSPTEVEVTINQPTSEAETNVPRKLAENCTDSQIEFFFACIEIKCAKVCGICCLESEMV